MLDFLYTVSEVFGMNYNYNLNRRPLTEVVCKHGSSKLFFTAIVLSIISTALSLLYGIYSSVAALDTELPFVDLGPFGSTTITVGLINMCVVQLQQGSMVMTLCFHHIRATVKQ